MDEVEKLPPARQLSPEEEARIEHLFTYHAPTPDKNYRYIRLRATAQVMAHCIFSEVPEGADREAALRKLRECIMTANAGIALNGKK